MAHPEDELERLTKKMLYDMEHPPSEEYFGESNTMATLNAIDKRMSEGKFFYRSNKLCCFNQLV